MYSKIFLGMYSAIANWRFGTYREDFSSMGNCLLMNFMMMFGEFPGISCPIPFPILLFGLSACLFDYCFNYLKQQFSTLA